MPSQWCSLPAPILYLSFVSLSPNFHLSAKLLGSLLVSSTSISKVTHQSYVPLATRKPGSQLQVIELEMS